jgi:hypothetical protein
MKKLALAMMLAATIGLGAAEVQNQQQSCKCGQQCRRGEGRKMKKGQCDPSQCPNPECPRRAAAQKK